MKNKYTRRTLVFILQFGNNKELARESIDKLISYYELTGNKYKIDELFKIKQEIS